MGEHSRKDVQISLRLTADEMQLIVRAADAMGIAISAFCIGALVDSAQSVAMKGSCTALSKRDALQFEKLIDDRDSAPNHALRAAANRYKSQVQ